MSVIVNIARKEEKYMVSRFEYSKLLHFFKQSMRQDAHNGIKGYNVRSLYFDSLFDDDFYEKEDGIEKRKKIRLRLYDLQSSYVKLELKEKEGENQKKTSLKMPKEDAEALISGKYSVLLKYKEPLINQVFYLMNRDCYQAKTIIEYKREAFIADGNEIRITFDSDIRATESCFNLFSENLCLNPVFPENYVVMEVKYNQFLFSYVKDILKKCNVPRQSVSKYCLGRSQTIDYVL